MKWNQFFSFVLGWLGGFAIFYNIAVTYSYVCIFSCFFLSNAFRYLQSDDDCCNSCEEVREMYRKKGWALTNPDLIDQVSILVVFLFDTIDLS